MTEAEAETVRAALFVAIWQADEVAGHCDGCFQTITGVDRSALPALMDELDELNGRNAQAAEYLSAEMEKLASLDDEALAAASHLPDILRIARARGLTIPARLQDRG